MQKKTLTVKWYNGIFLSSNGIMPEERAKLENNVNSLLVNGQIKNHSRLLE